MFIKLLFREDIRVVYLMDITEYAQIKVNYRK